MTTSPRLQIGPYTISRELGRGGMGVVFLANDTKLDRQVAIKALPAHLAHDPDRLARFQREAKVLASLNHPGIGAIHGLEIVENQHYLVLEYVEGESLADRLARGPLPIDEALPLAKQIAEALEAAHEKGIVHRDLKPANVMLTTEGAIKVLDFGLARTADGPAPSTTGGVGSPDSPTLTTPPPIHSPTIAGTIMGTAGYMSPEQARGKSVDKRSDIFSFGCVLYEMLSGAQPFGGETVTDSLGAILHREPDWALLPPGTPPRIRELLANCLAKDRKQRLHDIGDARLALEHAAAGRDWAAATAGRGPSRPVLVAAFLLSAAAIITTGWMLGARFSTRPGIAGPVFASIDPAPGSTITVESDISGPAVLSPDGRLIAYSARDAAGGRVLCLQALNVAEPDPLNGTERAVFPFWSPDSRSIGFFANGKLRCIDLSTRTVRTLAEAPAGRGGAWLDSGDIVFTPAFQAGLFRVGSASGEPRPLTVVDGVRFKSHRWPSAVRGTDRFTYLAVNHDPGKRNETSVFIASLDGTLNKELFHTPFGAQVADNRLLFLRESTLMAVPIDTAAGTIRGEPVPLIAQVFGNPSTWHAGFSASDAGTLVYHQVPPADPKEPSVKPQAGLGEAVRATVVDRAGRPLAVAADGMLQNRLAVSPDGLSLAVSGRWPNDTSVASYDIWVFAIFGPGTDVATSKFEPAPVGAPPRRFSFMPGDEVSPRWSPDGKSIAFAKVYGPEPLGLFVKPLDGGEQLLQRAGPNDTQFVPTGWSPDGRYIICRRGAYVGGGDAAIVAVPAGGGAPIDLVAAPGTNANGTVSNDGKWLAFDTGAGGPADVLVVPFPPGWEAERAAGRPLPDFAQRHRVSIAGGALPVWGPGGTTLYYASTSNSMIAVRWSTDGVRFAFDAGQPLFDFPLGPSTAYDVFPGEGLFAVNTMLTPRDSKLRLVLNWPMLLNTPGR